MNVLYALEEKAGGIGWRKNCRRVWYVLFGVAGFTEELKEHAALRDDLLLFHDLED